METKIKKALIWDPYLDTLGGGERYALTVADCLGELGFKVTIPWSEEEVLDKAKKRFGLELKSANIDSTLFELFRKKSSIPKRIQLQRNFDLIFWVSDGSVPLLFGKRNLLHYQVPFKRINGSFLGNQLKLLTTTKIVVNSRFTQKVIRRTLPNLKTTVLYPPIDVSRFSPGRKEKLILNVGRFVSPSHPKRQDVLIEAYRSLSLKVKGWKLVLAGGHKGEPEDLASLRKAAAGLDVEFLVNPDFIALKNMYARASIYWHAAGFGVDENQEPEKVEHFGITTVEAMSAGCVPVVINKGGQKEIVTKDTGFLFEDVPQLVTKTEKLIHNSKLLNEKSISAQDRAEVFSQRVFCDNLFKLVQ